MPLSSQVHVPSSIKEERDMDIEQREGKWCLLSKSTGEVLGCHASEAEAQAQERAIKAKEHAMDCCKGKEEKCEECRKLAMLDTFGIDGVEVFAEGEWNGDKYSSSDLDTLVSVFAKTKGFLKPYLKLGHSEGQKLLAADELPAAGWIEHVYRKGSKLLADFSGIPKKVYELIQAKAYKRVSAEIFIRPKVGGEVHPMALKAVALLGAETPAVHSLQDIQDSMYRVGAEVRAYGEGVETRSIEQDFSHADQALELKEGQEMDELKKQIGALEQQVADGVRKLAEAVAKAVGLEKQVADAGAANAELKQGKEAAEAKFAQASKELGQERDTRRTGEINATLDKLVADKKIVPAQREAAFILLKNSDLTGERKFKVADKEYSTAESLVLAFIEAGSGSGLSTKEKSESGEAQASAVADRAKQYAEKNKVSYRDALIAVSAGKS